MKFTKNVVKTLANWYSFPSSLNLPSAIRLATLGAVILNIIYYLILFDIQLATLGAVFKKRFRRIIYRARFRQPADNSSKVWVLSSTLCRGVPSRFMIMQLSSSWHFWGGQFGYSPIVSRWYHLPSHILKAKHYVFSIHSGVRES